VNNTVEIIIKAVDRNVKQVFQDVDRGAKSFRDTVQSMNGKVSEFTGSLRNMLVGLGAFQVLRESVGMAKSFTETMESTRLGIASLIYSMMEIPDASGRVMTGVEKYSRALQLAERIQERLRIKGLETAGTYEQLSKALSQAFVPAVQAGMDPTQIVEFVTAVVQAATSAGISLDMLGEEVRSILTGTMESRTTLLKPLIEAGMIQQGLVKSASEANDKIKELISQGKLYEALMKALEGASMGAALSQNTLKVSLSNLKDGIQNLLGLSTKSFWSALVENANRLTGTLYTVKDGVIVWDEAIRSAFEDVGKSMEKWFRRGTDFIAWAYNFAKAHSTAVTILKEFAWAATMAVSALVGLLVLDRIATALKAYTTAALAASAASKAFFAAIFGVQAALLGWEIGTVLSKIKVLGLSVGQWVEIGYAKADLAIERIKLLWKDLPRVIEGYMDAVARKLVEFDEKLIGFGKQNMPWLTSLVAPSPQEIDAMKASLDARDRARNEESAKDREVFEAKKRQIEQVIGMIEQETSAVSGATEAEKKAQAELDAMLAKLKGPKAGESDEETKKRVQVAAQTVKQRMELEEALTRKTNEELLKRAEQVEEAQKSGRISEMQYRESLKGIAQEQYDLEVRMLEKKKELAKSLYDIQLQGAKTPEQKEKFRIEFEATVTGLDADIARQKNALLKSLNELNEKVKTLSRERVETEVKALKDIAVQHGLSAQESLDAENRYFEARLVMIQLEREEISRKTGDAVLAKKWEVQEIRKAEEEILQIARERMDSEVSALKTIVDQEDLSLDQRRAAHEQYLQVRIRQTEIEREELRKKGVEETVLEQWTAAKIKEIRQELRGWNLSELRLMLRDTQAFSEERARIWQEIEKRIERGEASMFEAISLGMRKAAEDFGSAAKQMADVGKTWITGMRDGFKTLFLAPFKGGVKDIQDWFSQFANAMMDKWAEMIANMIVQWLFFRETTSGAGGGGFGGLLGGAIGWLVGAPTAHRGGVVGAEGITPVQPTRVFRLAPKLHDGLAGDEFPAILQTGEVVISRRDRAYLMSLLGGSGSGISRQDAAPTTPQATAGPTLNTNIVVNVPAGLSGQAAADPRASRRFGEEVGGIIRAKFLDMLREQMRPGGLLNQGLARG